MEREKPYFCEGCGKRYKNLNGLKYHKNHNERCVQAIEAQQQQHGASQGPDLQEPNEVGVPAFPPQSIALG